MDTDSLSVSGDEGLGKIRPSKSETSLTESFVIVSGNGEEVGEMGSAPTPPARRHRQNQHVLREGILKFDHFERDPSNKQ